MSPTIAIAYALTRFLLTEVSPAWLAELGADPRATTDPGLRAASTIVTRWLKDLRRDREAALDSDRLGEALRRALVCIAARGRVCVPVDPIEGPWLELSPLDMAFLETLRERAATMDAMRGTSVVADFDAHREAMIARMFELAERAAEAARQRGRHARR